MSKIGHELIEAMQELVDYSEGKIDLRTTKLNVAPDRKNSQLHSEFEEANKMIEEKIKNRWEEILEEKAIRVAERALGRGAEPEDVAYDSELPLSKVLEIKEKMSC